MKALSVILVIIATVLTTTQCAKILVIWPHYGKSHYMNVKPFFLELAKRGHNLTVISFFPLEAHEKVDNFYDISLEGSVQDTTNNVSISMFDSFGMSILSKSDSNLMGLNFMSNDVGSNIFKVKELRNFINDVLNKGHDYDLAMIETFNMELFLGLIYKMKIPFISMTTCNLFPWTSDRIGLTNNPSYIPTNIDVYQDEMNIYSRIKNTISLFKMKLFHQFLILPRDQDLAYKYFGKDIPPLQEIAKNTSLVLANIHFSVNKPRPIVPQLIEIGGLHIKPARPIDKGLDKYLNESLNGVIYFSMGSVLRGETFPAEKRKAFVEAFATLPYNVIWKYEGQIKGLPKNVKLMPWTPQRDILAHPKIKLFITHGGLLGTTEAVYEGVPMVGIPMFGDQDTNMRAIQSLGGGRVINYKDISKDLLVETITEVMKTQYAKTAKLLQARFRDRPSSPMETAIYWTEYVLRHDGAHHLRTAAVNMPWYQVLCLDIIVIISFAVISCVYLIYMICVLTCRLMCGKQVKSKME